MGQTHAQSEHESTLKRFLVGGHTRSGSMRGLSTMGPFARDDLAPPLLGSGCRYRGVRRGRKPLDGRRRRGVAGILLSATLLFALAGCASYFTSGSPPLYYEIDYPASTAACAAGWPQGARVWPLSASAPYDREEMIILDADHKVRFSSVFRWVALPGAMVSDRLLRDLARSPLFGGTTTSAGRLAPALELSGHIHRFAWEERGAGGKRAVLDVELSLWREEPKREVLFRHHYHFESPPTTSGSPETMAAAMSGLVRELSLSLQQDLCSTKQGSSSPGGD